MSSGLITAYILIWPIISAVLLVQLCVALWRDIKQARKDGTELV